MAEYEPTNRGSRLWTVMLERYPALAKTHGEMCPPAWGGVADNSSDYELRRALTAMPLRHPRFPPTLDELKAMMVTSRPATQLSDAERLMRYALTKYGHEMTGWQLAFGFVFLHDGQQCITALALKPHGKMPGLMIRISDIEALPMERMQKASVGEINKLTATAVSATNPFPE